jgi:hypothetical protein
MFARITATATLTMMIVVGVALTYETPATSGEASSNATTSSLGEFSPTFVGTAATGCNNPGCSLLIGPFFSPSTASYTPDAAVPHAAAAAALSATGASAPRPRALPFPRPPRPAGADPTPPTVNCQPLGPGCDRVSLSSGGAVGVKGINAVDSATQSTNVLQQDIEPADQGLCAGNGYVVETNNLGEILIFNTALQRKSAVIPLDTVMGLTSRGWSSGGDVSCLYDYSNGGHWFFTEFVSASTEASGGTFAGCFAGVANACYEGIAVSVGSSPFGPYNVYFLSADYNPDEPGYPYLLNDFAKIASTRDAFLVFYDEFPLVTPGVGGGGFNGAQEYAFNKNALEFGEPTRFPDGTPNPFFTVAIENMGLVPTPDGTCASTSNPFNSAGVTCWYEAIPAQAPDPTQFDNSHFGSGFIMAGLDFIGQGDTRIAVFDWTGLANLNSFNCLTCSGIRFGGQLFSNLLYYYGEGTPAAQKSGPIPLGDECGAAGLTLPGSTLTSCPEQGVATNGDSFTQVSQAQGQLWTAAATAITQSFGSSTEVHQGAVYWVIGTESFDRDGVFSLTSQGYVSPAHEDLEFPAMAAEGFFEDGGNGGAIMTFTLSGNGGPTGADNGGFYPSTAYGRVSSTSNGLSGSEIHIADLGQSPQDGFTEYDGLPGPTRPRWGDYSWAIYLPWSGGKIIFATNYIQYPNCVGSAFTLTVATCGGTRDGFANWGTSVNYVVP